jgi:hypothetical protein
MTVRPQRFGRPLVVVGATLLGIAVLGCGDDDNGGLTLSEYFLNVEEIRQDYQLEAEDLQLEFESVNPNIPDDALQGLLDYYKDSLDSFEAAIDQLEALDPPSEAEDAHESFVEAGRAVVVETTAVYEQLVEAESVEEANQVLEESSTADAAAADFQVACGDLQAVADAEGIAAGLGCGE